jgi:hypothetical protein
VLAILLATGSIPEGSGADSLLSIGPLAKIDEIAVVVGVGETLSVDTEPAVGLFQDDEEGLGRFKADLRSQLSALLLKGGLRVSDQAEASLGVLIYGGKFSASGSKLNFFLAEFSGCPGGDSGCGPVKSVLGTATDSDLAADLTRVSLEVVTEFVKERSRYRASRDLPHNQSLERTRSAPAPGFAGSTIVPRRSAPDPFGLQANRASAHR